MPTCPLSDVGIGGADEGAAFDSDLTRDVLSLVLIAATHDAQRADYDLSAVGVELGQLALPRTELISHTAFVLAVRLRQLDCAVWARTQLDHARLYADIIGAARTELTRLGGPRPATPVMMPVESHPSPLLPPQKPQKRSLTPEQHRRAANRFLVGGGIAIAAGIGFFIGAAVVTSSLAANPPPAPCARYDSFCDHTIADGLYGIGVGEAVGLWISGIFASLGGVFLHLAEKHSGLSTVQPMVSIAPNGGEIGLKIRF